MTGSVETVGGGPVFYRFLAVSPDQPDAVAIALFARSAQLIRELEQDGRGRAAIIRAYESRVAQGIDRIVVAQDDDDAVFCAGKLRDDVADGKLPFYGVSGEGVVFYLICIEMVGF